MDDETTGPHPRPQLVRKNWTDLCGDWGFAVDDLDAGLGGHWESDPAAFERSITVPFPPESKLSGVVDRDVHRVVWYRRELHVDEPAPGRRLLLHFGAVDYRATVWLNGQLLGTHEGGHTPFHFDVTNSLVAQRSQVITVRVEDPVDDPAQPRGKQDWLPRPHGIWYHRTTGIWQPVWLEEVSATHLESLQWATDVATGRVTLRAAVAGPGDAASLRVRLTLDAELLAEVTSTVLAPEIECDLTLVAAAHGQHLGVLLWSPESPTLIDAELTLFDTAGAEVDRVSSYVGYRSVGVGDGRFLLNGLPYYLRLALEQGYWPESHLAAPSAIALRREVELVKAMGFNGIRVHQKVEDPRFLYWCDRLGLLVWDEMPSAYAFTPRAVERVVAEWTEIVRRDRNHPSVVTWVPLNESWGVPHISIDARQRHHATALYHLTKALDSTRPVISNDGWEHTESDIWGVHDYAASGEVLRERYAGPARVSEALHERRPGRRRVLLGDPEYRGQPVVLSEFGGISLTPSPGQEWFGYGTVDTQEDYEARFAEVVSAVLDSAELAGFCYTQLTDTEQERNGLLTEDRVPKIPLERVRAIITRASRAIPSEQIDASRRQAREAALGAGGATSDVADTEGR